MAMIRATFFFKDVNGYGWTETIHTSKGTLELALAAAQLVLPLRVRCMGNSSALTFIRVSDDLVRRDSLVFKVPAGNQVNNDPLVGGSDIANTCIVCRLEASALVRRTLSMRGIPDDVVTQSGQLIGNPAFINAFVRWANQLKVDGWSIKSKDTLAPVRLVAGLTQALPSGDITVTINAGAPLNPNDEITITSVKGATTVNGNWRVFNVIDATHFIIKSTQLMNPWLGGGVIRPNLFVLTTIAGVLAVKVSHRISGRPFDSPHGRRKARTRR